MFTIQQIKTAHSKVKSGADFPTYIQEIKSLGVVSYDHYVSDGHTNYFGTNGFTVTAEAKYPAMEVADKSAALKLKEALTIHQHGQTDYLSFCRQATKAGVEKWIVDMTKMICTYYDKTGNTILVEQIP